MGRPLIARRQVEIARQVGADALAHGCTGKGNDQVRFELTYAAFAPDLPVIAPWREWNIRSREDAIAYAEAHKIPVAATRDKIYSRDRNVWHISHEGGMLEQPAVAPPADLFMLTSSPENAPDHAEEVTIGFHAGTPVSVNGDALDAVDIVVALSLSSLCSTGALLRQRISSPPAMQIWSTKAAGGQRSGRGMTRS